MNIKCKNLNNSKNDIHYDQNSQLLNYFQKKINNNTYMLNQNQNYKLNEIYNNNMPNIKITIRANISYNNLSNIKIIIFQI